MRFDDRLSTILDGNYDSPRARVLRWQQLTDIVAQSGAYMPEALASRTLHMISLLSGDVPPLVLAAQAAAVASHCQYAPLLVLLANHGPSTAEAIIPRARLSDDDWLSALPQLGPVSRALLRQRRDISPRVSIALQLFAAGDMAIGHAADLVVPADHHPAEIRDLVRRIEEYRQRQQDQAEPIAAPVDAAQVSPIAFLTDAAARIIDAETRGRGRFVGIELGQPAAAFESGCDAGTARVIGKRGRVENGRLLIQGNDKWSGTWLCQAEPRFADISGAFRGYAGYLRRPAPHEIVEPLPSPPSASVDVEFRPELLRQLMHELRSPLNAIGGFAQLIEGQYAGPVAGTYLDAARTILVETGRLSDVIDEIDLLAQLSGVARDSDETQARLSDILTLVAADLEQGRRPVHLVLGGSIDPQGLWVPGSRQIVARLLHLWLHALPRTQVGGEQIALTVNVDAPAARIQLSIDRMADANSEQGFAFAAATELARQCGGMLEAGPDQHILNLPLVEPERVSGEKVG